MGRSIFSQSWHHVAQLRPRLLSHTRIFRHTYRGKLWYVVHDTTGGRYHRISPSGYAIVRKMDGNSTVQDLWDDACQRGGDSIPTQDEMVELLVQLHSHDLMQCNVTPDVAEVFERYSKRRRQRWVQSLLNPMGIRIPLFDPDAILTSLARPTAWLFSKTGFLFWSIVVFPALFLAAEHWNEFTENISDRVLAENNLLLLAVVFAAIKVAHELAHGLATKVWGGSVHETGIMFLVFAPIPYVDASASSTFSSKHQRAIVGASGMMAELFIAALAIYVWVVIEPGTLRSIFYNVIFVTGVSTLIVNGNPLLRFDGYYILSDLIEIPNLAQRGKRYLTYLSDRYLFGARDITPPDESPSEKRWLVIYNIAAWFYRIFVAISIMLFVSGKFFFFGILIAIWSATTLFLLPIWKSIKHLRESPSLQRNRSHASKVALSLVTAAIIIICVIPIPLHTVSQGVVWLPEQALVRADSAGFLRKWIAVPGTYVEQGAPLFVLDDLQLKFEVAAAKARVVEARTRYRIEQFENPVKAEVALQQLNHEERAYERTLQRSQSLTVYSESAGIFTVSEPQDKVGKYFQQGELIGYVMAKERLIARVAIDQSDIEMVQDHIKDVRLRYVDRISESYPVRVLRHLPSALDELPSVALGSMGGGNISVMPSDPKGLKTLQHVFYMDLSLPSDVKPDAFGGRVYVRFTHPSEPLFTQWYRGVRQLLLRQFHV